MPEFFGFFFAYGLGVTILFMVGLANHLDARDNVKSHSFYRTNRAAEERRIRWGARVILIAPIWPLFCAYWILYFLVYYIAIRGPIRVFKDAALFQKKETA